MVGARTKSQVTDAVTLLKEDPNSKEINGESILNKTDTQ